MAKGLDHAEADRARQKYGPNELDKEPPKSLLELVMEQFEDLLVRILLLAAGTSFLLVSF